MQLSRTATFMLPKMRDEPHGTEVVN